MEFIDAHCHIIPPWFDTKEKLDKLKKRAMNKGVARAYSVSSEPETYQWVLQNADEFYGVCIGLQPTHISEESVIQLRETLENNQHSISALGEVGLDYYWVKEAKQQQYQQEVFKKIIELANEMQMPLVIHSRKAELDAIDILERTASVPVLMHSFQGNIELIKRVLDNSWSISVPTAVVNRKGFRRTAKNCELDNLLLETDSPFLSPIKDVQNEPSHIPISARYVADMHEVDLEELAAVTTRNARSFFLN